MTFRVDFSSVESRNSNLKEIHEAEYAILVKNKTSLNFQYWENRDEIRYYNELFNELEEEDQKMDYPKLTDKLFLILCLTASFYLRFQNPDIWLYRFLCGSLFIYTFYSVIREFIIFGTTGHSFTNVSKMHKGLEPLIAKNVVHYDNMVKYHALRLRLFALDHRKLEWKVIVLALDFVLDLVLLTCALVLIFEKDSLIKPAIFDGICYVGLSVFGMIFSGFHFYKCADNWEWLLNLKSRLY
ncbi:unnamed protein product [Caenorhabditis brenneri]